MFIKISKHSTLLSKYGETQQIKTKQNKIIFLESIQHINQLRTTRAGYK